jgi:hypothetical protein
MNVSARIRKGTNGTSTAINTVLSMRGIGGQLLPIGHGKLAMMRDGDDLKPVSERYELVMGRENPITFDYPGTELFVLGLGEIARFFHAGKRYEAVLGLEASRQTLSILNFPMVRNKFGVNSMGHVVGVTYPNLLTIVDAINKDFGLNLGVFENAVAASLVRREGPALRAKDISAFWTTDEDGSKRSLHGVIMPSFEFHDPQTTNAYTGIVLGRRI